MGEPRATPQRVENPTMKVGQVWRGRHSDRLWMVLWMGHTEGHDGEAPRCSLAPLSESGQVQEDESWDWVDRIEGLWTYAYDSPAMTLGGPA